MADQNRNQQQGNDLRYGQGVDQFGESQSQPGAFGQRGYDRYQANDEFPQRTGNVSWQPDQQGQQRQGQEGQHRGK